jgi:formylmethanofuran dehydrogenase subunit D
MIDLTSAEWFSSSYSGNGGNCVEVSTSFGGSRVVPVRDSKMRGGAALVVPAGAWSAFVATVKDNGRV